MTTYHVCWAFNIHIFSFQHLKFRRVYIKAQIFEFSFKITGSENTARSQQSRAGGSCPLLMRGVSSIPPRSSSRPVDYIFSLSLILLFSLSLTQTTYLKKLQQVFEFASFLKGFSLPQPVLIGQLLQHFGSYFALEMALEYHSGFPCGSFLISPIGSTLVSNPLPSLWIEVCST